MDDGEHLFRKLYVEAASACGDDVHAIACYVETRIAELSDDDQRRVRDVSERVLAFQAPAKRPELSH